jgi:hypothetical protein
MNSRLTDKALLELIAKLIDKYVLFDGLSGELIGKYTAARKIINALRKNKG